MKQNIETWEQLVAVLNQDQMVELCKELYYHVQDDLTEKEIVQELYDRVVLGYRRWNAQVRIEYTSCAVSGTWITLYGASIEEAVENYKKEHPDIKSIYIL